MKFLRKNHFIAKGKKQSRYVGLLDGKPCAITFHYHKDNDVIPTGTLSAIARQVGMSKQNLINIV